MHVQCLTQWDTFARQRELKQALALRIAVSLASPPCHAWSLDPRARAACCAVPPPRPVRARPTAAAERWCYATQSSDPQAPDGSMYNMGWFRFAKAAALQCMPPATLIARPSLISGPGRRAGWPW